MSNPKRFTARRKIRVGESHVYLMVDAIIDKPENFNISARVVESMLDDKASKLLKELQPALEYARRPPKNGQ